MGCIRRIGCLVVLVVVLVVAWLTRDRWRGAFRGSGDTAIARSDDPWESLTPAGAARARAALQRLGQPASPAFANLRAGDLASFVVQGLRSQLPPSIDSLQAAAIGDRLFVRGTVKLSEIGAEKVLGGLASFLGERERIQFGGTFHIVRPGLAEFQVKELRLRDFPVPTTAIPRLLRQIERGSRPAGLSDDGLPLLVPQYIGDVRVSDRQVTLYKTVR